jgi:hypothetical protein
MSELSNTLPRLELPKRWELLEQQANNAGLDAKEFVIKIDSAAERVDKLLRRVRTGSGGLLEIVFGLSGSGKTTFLNTLPKFFDKIKVSSFDPTRSLSMLPTYIKETYLSDADYSRIVLIERRDNPKLIELDQVEEMFADLLNQFREQSGKVLVLWPITKKTSAQKIADIAWNVGRDSMVLPDTKGLYEFKGVPRERYYELSDLTTRNLSGDGLEAFGLDEGTAQDIVMGCETIADFYDQVNEYTEKRREDTWSVLKERVRARLWVLLPGDDVAALNASVSALTQGRRNRIDIDKIAEFIDKPETKAPLYIAEWKKRRASLAHNLRAIDTRIFEVPPTVALAAMRSFGDDSIKRLLKQPATNLDQSKKTMRASRFYKAILTEAHVEVAPLCGPTGNKTGNPRRV